MDLRIHKHLIFCFKYRSFIDSSFDIVKEEYIKSYRKNMFYIGTHTHVFQMTHYCSQWYIMLLKRDFIYCIVIVSSVTFSD